MGVFCFFWLRLTVWFSLSQAEPSFRPYPFLDHFPTCHDTQGTLHSHPSPEGLLTHVFRSACETCCGGGLQETRARTPQLLLLSLFGFPRSFSRFCFIKKKSCQASQQLLKWNLLPFSHSSFYTGPTWPRCFLLTQAVPTEGSQGGVLQSKEACKGQSMTLFHRWVEQFLDDIWLSSSHVPPSEDSGWFLHFISKEERRGGMSVHLGNMELGFCVYWIMSWWSRSVPSHQPGPSWIYWLRQGTLALLPGTFAKRSP